jgi:hypothetical protein
MAKSRRLRQLISRLNFLEENILPSARVNGNYTKKEQDLIRSYVLLSHAEIEAYIEDKAKDRMSKALADWVRTRKKSSCLKSVLAYTGNEIDFSRDQNAVNNIEHRIQRTVAHYLNSVVDRNHGVKEKNIISMLLPLGIEYGELDQTWLGIMESFGATRGNIAHNTTQVQNQIDRNTELTRIKSQILPELERVDELIRKLK